MSGNGASSGGKGLTPRRVKRVVGTESKILKAFQETQRRDYVILGEIQEEMLRNQQHHQDPDRRMDLLHPSELCKDDVCPRALYMRLAGMPSSEPDPLFFTLSNIYQEGTEIGERWQKRVHRLGRLYGMWECRICTHTWMATSPLDCPECAGKLLRYKEVPLWSDKHLIIASADIQLDDEHGIIGEIKSIGKGTLRFESPGLLEDHTYEVERHGRKRQVVDLEGVWDAIKRPFPTHLRQGNLYVYLARELGYNVDRVFFLYECKWNQATKEFSFRYNPNYVEPMLEMALDIKWALKNQTAPPCAAGAGVCQYCKVYENNGANDDGTRRIDGTGQGGSGGEAQAGQAGPGDASQTGLRHSQGADEDQRPGRSGANGSVREAHPVRRLRVRADGGGGDRRTVRRIRTGLS